MTQHHDGPTIYVWVYQWVLATNNWWHAWKEAMLCAKNTPSQDHGHLRGWFEYCPQDIILKMMQCAEEHGCLHTRQWGFWIRYTSTDATHHKMTFEFRLFIKLTIAIFTGLQQLCLDLIWPEVTNIASQTEGAKKNELQTWITKLDWMNQLPDQDRTWKFQTVLQK